jgi:hypothetical protein
MRATKANLGTRSRALVAAVVVAAVVSSAAGGTCLILSEVVCGAESGDCPNWIEITNTGLSDFTFDEGGIIIQMDDSNDVELGVDMSGITIYAGQSFVIVSNAAGCTGAFPVIYGMDADLYTNKTFGNGDDRYMITDTADGSNVIDIYGEFGVDGTGTEWEYTRGYSYRLPAYNAGSGQDFAPEEWFFGGPESLSGGDPTWLLLEHTTPKVHEYDVSCVPGDLDGDGCVSHSDLGILLADWGCSGDDCVGDCDDDGDTDHSDLGILLAHWGEGCP